MDPPLHRENPILPENAGLGSTLTVSASRHKLAAVRVCTVPRFVQKQTGDTSLRALAASAPPFATAKNNMSIVERIWEQLGLLFGAIGTLFSRLLTRFIGTDNLRQLRRLEDKVAAINALEPGLQQLSDEELQAQTTKFRERLRAGEPLDALLGEAFATCREAGRRFLEMRRRRNGTPLRQDR